VSRAEADSQIAGPAKLLWTGGWDSTYRLLELVLLHQRAVQPFYISLKRQSADIELRAMKQIKQQLFAAHPETRSRILETIFVEAANIPSRPDAWAALLRLREMGGTRRVGSQYYDFAAAAEHLGLDQLELGIHAEEGSFWYDRLKSNVESKDGVCRLVAEPDLEELEIFKRFAFPLLTLSKKDMAAKAEGAGFSFILDSTWFCHRPDRRGRPCGFCAPCRLTMKEGLERRIPRVNRIKHRLLWPMITAIAKHRPRHRFRRIWQEARRLVKRAPRPRLPHL
jgi:hypothetical protein